MPVLRRLSVIKETLINYKNQFSIPLFNAGATPASPARIHIVQAFLNYYKYSDRVCALRRIRLGNNRF